MQKKDTEQVVQLPGTATEPVTGQQTDTKENVVQPSGSESQSTETAEEQSDYEALLRMQLLHGRLVELFARHANDMIYATADAQLFFNLSDANMHAASLTDNQVLPINRSDIED
ncbi:hypothetical protein KTO58_19770 [Chitinophaga pendula]|uniref:hypothetical protein n=1 Tax=Chitinophaga TaxID=79328 RepID=UPI000BB08AE3|nr:MULTISPECIES: hypothetical protein [Chitinophaga]ASZ11094.1 hypothetical protein CK934_09030 [Chitinophaga sp. MD30]UCJ05909.1 hypothetical protein KTO58_19770 [Chitinophaga pendula]